MSHGSLCDFGRLGAIALFRRPHLDLHETVLGADALDANLRAGVRSDHASKGIRGIIVRIPVVKHPDRRQAWNRAQRTQVVNVGNVVCRSQRKRGKVVFALCFYFIRSISFLCSGVQEKGARGSFSLSKPTINNNANKSNTFIHHRLYQGVFVFISISFYLRGSASSIHQ